MARRRKLKKIRLTEQERVRVHDRRATDLLANALVSEEEVDDPYGQPGDKVLVFRSLRDDPLAVMLKRGEIDQGQYLGGRHWQKAKYIADIGNVQAIDPTKEAVDGGGIPLPGVTDEQIKAFEDLYNAFQRLGEKGDGLVNDILGRGMSIQVASAARGMTSEADRKFLGKRFRECLETLAVVYNYVSPAK